MKYKQLSDEPKAFVAPSVPADVCLREMLSINPQLYDEIISTPNFAYYFTQLANRAVHYDYIVKSIIPEYKAGRP